MTFLNACRNGQKGIVQIFLKKGGIDVDKRDVEGNTPLYHACLKGFRDIVNLLLDSDADVSIANNCSATPLHAVARSGNKEIIGKLVQYGAELDDTTASQVYNNVFETVETIHAVQETEGQILTNDGDVVNAYFFSTSCGTTCRNDDVWGGEKLDYLNDQLEIYTEADRKRLGDATVMLDHGYFQIGDGRLSTEEVFRAFIDQTVYVNSIEKEEPFYRWQVTLTADQIQTLAGADITDQTGEIEKVRITKRGNSGIARNMVLYGKQSSVTIEGQMEIRELLCSPDVVIRKQDGSETSGFDLLPSAYFYITQDKEGNYQLHGGGFGHGVGMSQNGANDLAEAGYGYEEILSHYYNGTELEKLRETGNKTNEE